MSMVDLARLVANIMMVHIRVGLGGGYGYGGYKVNFMSLGVIKYFMTPRDVKRYFTTPHKNCFMRWSAIKSRKRQLQHPSLTK